MRHSHFVTYRTMNFNYYHAIPKGIYNCLHLYILHVFDIIYRIWKFKMYHTLYYIFNYVAIYLDLPSKKNKLKLRHFFSLHNDVLKSCKTTWAVMSATIKV